MRLSLGIITVALLALLAGCRSRPSGVDYDQWKEALETRRATAARHVTAIHGFEVDLLHTATKAEGSWVSLEFDGQGRLLIGREGPGILRLTLPRWRLGRARVEVVNNELKECRGLLWAHGSLYANANNSKGLYRLRDTTGDDQFDEVSLLRKTGGGVGHGRNSIALGPDGLIYLTHGNDVLLPGDFNPGPASPYRNYRRDQLLPCDWNRVLFNQGLQPPAGHIIRTDRDGQRWEMIAGGFRNPYGLAFHPDGELFVYDADMEWDDGTPWYRPTRVNHVVSGGDYGWRQGTDKWPAYFPDSLPSNGDIGLGSPTAVAFGSGSQFPAPYRDALFILDWAYGKIIAVHLTPEGASYRGRAEEFVTGRPLNVTGVDFGPDGAMYFVTGGRRTQSGLYRVRYVGGESPALGQAADTGAKRARALRQRLERYHSDRSIEGVGLAWEHLGSDDPWIRHAARVALENQPIAQWQLPALTESDTRKALTALLALARVGEAGVQPQLFARLNDLPWEGLAAQWQLVALRAYQLGFTRMGDGQADDREAVVQKIVAAAEDAPELRMEVSRLLIYLEAPGIIPGLLNYVVDAKSPEERLFYLFQMRHIADGWTPAHRRAYFAWLKKMTESGGVPQLQMSYKHIVADALAKVPPGERGRVAAIFEPEAKPASPEPDALANREVEEWTMADFAGLGAGLAKRDLINGRRVLKAAACLACHRFGDEGLFLGPDLTGVGARFDARAMLESILEPSRVIDDKYRNVAITTREGELIEGRLVAERAKSLLVAPNPYQPSLTREVQRRAIASRNDSRFSPMPAGLLNRFSRDDVLDLLAALQAGLAKRNHP
ncbi:MAG: PQQ-dependent sugar dehydrogenase [Verrucomicrobia bacterium]|nr:PQQ-dependent sugar dehydrogenase [Verrucomicrobiota bacterium]